MNLEHFNAVTDLLSQNGKSSPSDALDQQLIVNPEAYVAAGRREAIIAKDLQESLDALFALFEIDSAQFEHRLDMVLGSLAIIDLELTEAPVSQANNQARIKLAGLKHIVGLDI